MKSHPSSEEVLDGLDDKMVTGLSRAVVLAARDLRQYRLTFPQWVSQSSERGLANWIHDRIWWHVTVTVPTVPGPTLPTIQGPITESKQVKDQE
ncbi:MAG TPA: hypothetical protein VF109_06120 [Mycobacteriales bacterium]